MAITPTNCGGGKDGGGWSVKARHARETPHAHREATSWHAACPLLFPRFGPTCEGCCPAAPATHLQAAVHSADPAAADPQRAQKGPLLCTQAGD